MPYLQKNGRWGTKVSFSNLRGQIFDRVTVVSMIAFDLASSSNAYWKCVCDCGRSFTSETRELVSLKITGCPVCMKNDGFTAEELLTVVCDNEIVPVGEEVIFRGNDTDFDKIRVEYRGRIFPMGRSLVRPTGQIF